jgi:hypothetical protein
MAEVPKDLKFLLFGMGARWHAKCAFALNMLGVVFIILGIIGDATNKALGLEATHWFILAIAFWVWGLWSWLTALNAIKEG